MTNRSKVIWNKHAYKAGTLLSRPHLPHVLQQRQDIKYEGVVGPLNKWVDQVRVSTKESVPYFDPRAATQGADVLVLLQDPSGEAQHGSGFISRDNNDPTAHNTTLAAEAGGLPYSRSLHWNVVPWQTRPLHHGIWLLKHAGPLPCWPSSWNCWSPVPMWFSSWANRRKRLGPSCCSRPLLSSRGSPLLRRPTRVRSPMTRQTDPRANPTENCYRKPSRGRQRCPEQGCVRTGVQAPPRSVIPEVELFDSLGFNAELGCPFRLSCPTSGVSSSG